MGIFLVALNSMLSLFICMAFGFICRKKGWINDEISAVLSNLLVKISLPCLILYSMQRPFSSALLADSILIVVLTTFFFVAGGLLGLALSRLMKLSAGETGIFSFVMAFPNTVYMGLPVLRAMFGDEAVFFIAMSNIPFNLLVFTMGAAMIRMAAKGSGQKRQSLRQALLTVPMVATVMGMILFFFSIRLPGFMTEAFRMTGEITTPVSMLLIGSMLAKSRIRDAFRGRMVYIAALLRLLLIPFLIYLLLRRLITAPVLLAVLCLIMAMPGASMTVILSEYYQSDTLLASRYVFVTTLLSMLTIPLFALLFNT